MSHPATSRRRPLVFAVAALPAVSAAVTLVLLAAPAAPVNSPTAAEPGLRAHEYTILQSRPDIDDAIATNEGLLADIRDVLTTTQHWGSWQHKTPSGPPITTGCNEFPNIDVYDAAESTTPIWYTAASDLDPQRWHDVRDAVSDVGHRFGFVPGPARSDAPGNYLLTLVDATGASAQISADINIVVSLSTGCHLDHAAHQRGTPAPENT